MRKHKLTVVCKIIFFIALTPFIITASGGLRWNTESLFYINIFAPNIEIVRSIVFTTSGHLLVCCYILELILLIKMIKNKEIKVNWKSFIIKILLILGLFCLSEHFYKVNNINNTFKFAAFVPLMWIFDFDDIVNYLIFIFPIRGLVLLFTSGTDVFIDKQNWHHLHAFGFSHANTTGFVIFFELLLLYYKFFNKQKIIMTLVGIGALLFNVLYIQSRTAEIATIALIIVFWINYLIDAKFSDSKAINKLGSAFKVIFKYLPLICFVACAIVGIAIYNLRLDGFVIDDAFEQRFVNPIYFYFENEFALIGLPENITNTYILDNIYGFIIVYYGIIGLILMLVCMLVINFEMVKKYNKFQLILFSFFFLYSIMERKPFTYAGSLLYWGSLLIETKNIVPFDQQVLSSE